MINHSSEWVTQKYPVMATNINSSFMAWFPAISNNDHIQIPYESPKVVTTLLQRQKN